MSADRFVLSDGRRHYQHGPIDLVIRAYGDADAVASAHAASWSRFTTILEELVAELSSLRRRVAGHCLLRGAVARRMWSACLPHSSLFVTPMAAVAGAVADELIGCYRRAGIDRAWINNGGDSALHLAPGASLRVGLFTDLSRLDLQRWRGRIEPDGRFRIGYELPVRGVATSGWRGRSFSLGIADSVTVLAGSAAAADAAATMIANAVDVDDPLIVRRPATSLRDDSDLGDLPVTCGVPTLGRDTVCRALDAGLARAEALRAEGLVVACVLVCQGVVVATGGWSSVGRALSPMSRVRPRSIARLAA